MIRRSASRKISDKNIPKDVLATEVDANSKVIIDKFALLSRIGSRNISFRGLEVGQEKDGHVNGVSITPEVVISTCLKNFTKLNLSLISWTLDGRVNNSLTSGFGHLRSLKLFNCQIGPSDCCNLSRALKDNKNIKSLDLSYNRIVGVHAFRNEVLGTYDSVGLVSVLSAILKSATIENLNLYGNYLGGIHCSKRPVSLRKRPEVQVSKATAKSADFSCSATTTVEIINEFLFLNQSVRILNLNANEFNNDNGTAESLLSHLKLHSNNCTLEEIQNSHSVYFDYSDKRRRSNESNTCRCTPANFESSPCQSLCGIIPENSRSDYDNLQYSNFRPPDPDLVDLSNMCLESFTGLLIGAEHCFKSSSLISLDLSTNPTFGNEGLKNFLLSYQTHNETFHLKSLCLRNTNLVGVCGPDGRASLEQLCLFLSLPQCSLTALDLSGNPLLGDDGMRIFFRGARDNKTLKYLNLTETSLTAKRSGTLISRFLMDNKHTQVLDLSNNSLGGAEFRSILYGLKTSSLKTLILDNNKFEGGSLKLLAEKIIDSRTCPLVHLCLRQNMLCGSRDHESFNPESVIKLSLALCDDSNRNLTQLDLSNCDIGARSAKKLFEVLKYNDSITVLDLSNCNISALGSVAVGEALPHIRNLKVLHLKENCIGPAGCESLFRGLALNNSLTWLDLSSNFLSGTTSDLDLEYDDAVMGMVADGIGENVTLKYLNLSDNSLFKLNIHNRLTENMSVEGVSHLSRGIRRNAEKGGSLTTLNIMMNIINLACSQAWVHVNQGLYDGSEESHRRAIVEFEQYQTSQINCAVDLIKAAKSHPHLQSLCGISPHNSPVKSDLSDQIFRSTPMPTTRLSLANQGVDDLMILVVAFDLANNHTVIVLDLEHNYIMAGGKMALAQALVSNVTLKTVHWTKQMDPLPPSAIYDEQRVRNAAINAKVECVGDQLRFIAFQFRISVATFVRGTVLGPATLIEVIEFLIGPGPQVGRFLRYRGPCHPSIY